MDFIKELTNFSRRWRYANSESYYKWQPILLATLRQHAILMSSGSSSTSAVITKQEKIQEKTFADQVNLLVLRIVANILLTITKTGPLVSVDGENGPVSINAQGYLLSSSASTDPKDSPSIGLLPYCVAQCFHALKAGSAQDTPLLPVSSSLRSSPSLFSTTPSHSIQATTSPSSNMHSAAAHKEIKFFSLLTLELCLSVLLIHIQLYKNSPNTGLAEVVNEVLQIVNVNLKTVTQQLRAGDLQVTMAIIQYIQNTELTR